jgi:ubiquitin carboxyl-terminal hydrolase 4/11/15
MNSIIQCLSNCPVLTNFFLDARYVRDINKENPLGLKGKLANSYTSLLKEIWSGEYRAVAPSEFKKALSDFAPRFSGYQQHDSQELLAFMLDGLHEDLNRIKLKPYTKSVEDQGRTDTEIAEESWKMHLMRNQSIIVDLFQGQLKSTVTCPDCSRISITFDPFMFLSVPLPSKESRLVKLELLGVKGRPSMIYGVDITDLTKMSQLIEHLAKLSGIDSRLLVVSEYADSNISRVFPEAYDLRNLRMDEKLIVCEQSEQTLTTNSSDWVGVLFSYSKDDGMYRFGIPFMIMFDTKSTVKFLLIYL